MAIPALPSGWSSYTPQQKISWFNANGTTVDELLGAGVPQSDITWMLGNGYAPPAPAPAPAPTPAPAPIQQENVYTQTAEPVYQEPVYTPPASTPAPTTYSLFGLTWDPAASLSTKQGYIDTLLSQGRTPTEIRNAIKAIQPSVSNQEFSLLGVSPLMTDQAIMNSYMVPQNTLDSVVNSLVNNLNTNGKNVAQTAKTYGLTADDLSGLTGLPTSEINQYFLASGLPQGTILTGDVQRTTGNESIRQLNVGEDRTIEQAIGTRDGKIVVQQYDAYGTPTGTRLAEPNAPEWQGWLKAAGITLGAIGLSNLATTGSVLGGTTTGTTTGATTGGTLATDTGLLSGATTGTTTGATTGAATGATTGAATGGTGGASLTISGTSLPTTAGTGTTAAVGGGLLGGTLATTGGTTTTPTTTTTTTTPTTTATGATAGATVGGLLSPSTLGTLATGLVNGLTNTNAQNILGGLISSGANLAMVQDAADKLRQQGQLTQTEYTNLANTLGSQYTLAGGAARLGQTQIAEGILPYTQTLGSTAQKGLMNVGQTAANMVGEFTPYGVTGSLFGTTYDPKTGQVNTALTEDARAMYNPFAQAAMQSAQAANMTNVDQLSQDYYNKLTALSAPEIERQRLATEARLRAQGRLGVSGSAFGGSSPELLAQEQAIARQQLERELQSRQAALGERGTLLSQGTAALAPIQQLTQQQMAQAQLSGQLGQLAQQGRISAAGLFAQPAAQGYMTQAQTGLAGQQLAANAQQAGVQQELQAKLAGLNTQGNLRSLGLAGNLQAQQEALAGLLGSRQNVANQILGNQGALGGLAGNLLGGLFNQTPSDIAPGTNMTYAQALANGLIGL